MTNEQMAEARCTWPVGNCQCQAATALRGARVDREAVARLIDPYNFREFIERHSETKGVVFEIVANYPGGNTASRGIDVRDFLAILALLASPPDAAGKKSDGGVEGHATASEGVSYPNAQANGLPSTGSYRSTGEDAPAGPRAGSGIETAGVEPCPSDPTPLTAAQMRERAAQAVLGFPAALGPQFASFVQHHKIGPSDASVLASLVYDREREIAASILALPLTDRSAT